MRSLGRRRFLFEYLTVLSVCVAGVLNGSWLWPLMGAMVLLLTGWDRYSELFAQAGKIDHEWRELAGLARDHGHIGLALGLYLRARVLVIVLGAKLGHDALFLVGAFFAGHLTRWFWVD
jgi:hypothetical protein